MRSLASMEPLTSPITTATLTRISALTTPFSPTTTVPPLLVILPFTLPSTRMVPLKSMVPSILASEPIKVDIRSVFFSFFIVVACPLFGLIICFHPQMSKLVRFAHNWNNGNEE